MNTYIAKKCDTAPNWNEIPVVELEQTYLQTPEEIRAYAQLAWSEDTLWLHMSIKVSHIRAQEEGALGMPCRDSCLEFFFAPDSADRRYFNFEFNPLGTIYLGFGAERATRVRQILRDSRELFSQKPFFTDTGWGIEFRIPLSFIQMYFPGYTCSGESCCNFYKCGDRTEVPHYLAWAPLTSNTPDYHRRQDFGILKFSE